jgi:pyruvate dehydrogenase E2 component (dihydrolipoamide acetyltransferase)
MSDILLPDLGEGVVGGVVTSISVKVGDVVKANDPLIEIETDKAVLPVPAPEEGVILKILVAEGDKISVGQAIASLEGGAKVAEPVNSEVKMAPSEPSTGKPATSPDASAPAGGSTDVVLPDLGEGVAGGTVTAIPAKIGSELSVGDALLEIETDKAVLPVPAPCGGKLLKVTVSEGDKITVGQVIARMSIPGGSVVPDPASEAGDLSLEAPPKVESQVSAPKVSPNREPVLKASKATSSPGAGIAAGPATRKLARELGVDLAVVQGSKRGGRIAVEDVKAHVKALKLGSRTKPSSGTGGGLASPDWPRLPDFSKFGGVRREKMSNIRSIISGRMSMSWNRVPHVFQFNEVDLTYLTDVQKRFKDDFKAKGSSVSPTNFIIKAMAICLKEFPQFNASLDEESGEIIYKDYVNIGVAVDTPTGLIVPVLKGVDQMSIFDIGKNLKELAQRTRERKVTQEELSGGSMTLSNLGGIGGSHFTPIVNWPEVAILGVGRSETKPKWIDGEFKPRECTQLTLSYDHRVIDGADGARFMVRLSQILENIERTLLGG